jgi:hypothetical protein
MGAEGSIARLGRVFIALNGWTGRRRVYKC